MKIVLLGPPGSGKGTQADVLTKKMLLPHISTGDMFRAAIKNGTEMGALAKSYIDNGALVPDEVTVGIIKDRVAQPDCADGFLLDGFPRTIAQAQALNDLLAEQGGVDAVINISIPLDRLLVRLTGRRSCLKCGLVYHMLYHAPETEGVCDACGGELYQRNDDKEETVANRLEVYEAQTAPLIAFYEEQGILHTVNGDQPIPAVTLEVGAALGLNWA